MGHVTWRSFQGATIHVPCQVFPAHFDGLVQDCSNSSALAMELLQSCAEPSIRRSVARTWFTEARTSNELPWLDLQKGHRNRNPSNEPPGGTGSFGRRRVLTINAQISGGWNRYIMIDIVHRRASNIWDGKCPIYETIIIALHILCPMIHIASHPRSKILQFDRSM